MKASRIFVTLMVMLAVVCVNVPARALQELARIAQQAPSEALAVSVGQNQVIFEFGDIVLSSRLIDGQLRVIPKKPVEVKDANPAPGAGKAGKAGGEGSPSSQTTKVVDETGAFPAGLHIGRSTKIAAGHPRSLLL